MPEARKPRAPRPKREFVRIGIRLPAEQVDLLNDVATATGVSVEDQIRAATVRLVADLGAFNDFTYRLASLVEQANAPEVVRKLPEAGE